MVHLHCAERGAAPRRPTDDVDTVLDVRAEPHVLHGVTAALYGLGFRPAGVTWTGHQHRWELEDAAIDILRQVAKAGEVVFGRPAPDPDAVAAKLAVAREAMKAQGKSAREAAAMVGWSRSTPYRVRSDAGQLASTPS
jgi:hypothetical protein